METQRSTFDWFLEGLSGAALLAAIGDVALHWSILPQRIPTHFDAAGNPNGWGGKSMLLFLLATTVAVAIVLTAAEKYQRLINIPMSVDRDSPQARHLLRSMMIALKAVIVLIFFWIVDVTMRTALGEARGLGRAFLPLFLAGLLLPLVYYLTKLSRQ
jgi:uncharacterized membrane protein